MADAHDSTDVVGEAVAAAFDPSLPGRGVARTGPGRLLPFQSAYAGGCHRGRTGARGGAGRGAAVRCGGAVAGACRAAGRGARGCHRPLPPRRRRSPPRPRPRGSPHRADRGSTSCLTALDLSGLEQGSDVGAALRPDRRPRAAGAAHARRSHPTPRAISGSSVRAERGKSALLRTLADRCGERATSRCTSTGSTSPAARSGCCPRSRTSARSSRATTSSAGPGCSGRCARCSTTAPSRSPSVNASTITEYRSAHRQRDEPRILLLVDNFQAFRDAFDTDRDRRADTRRCSESCPRGGSSACTSWSPPTARARCRPLCSPGSRSESCCASRTTPPTSCSAPRTTC